MDYILFLVFSVILAALLGFIYLKEIETKKKFSRFEKVIEGVIQENFALKKQLLSLTSTNDGSVVDLSVLERQLDEKIESRLSEKILPLFNSLKSIESTIDEFQSEQQSRIYNLEERTRDINKITPPSMQSEEEQIIRLFNDGKSSEVIAKDLRLGIGRVEFVLKMHRLI
ncbi:DUF6115 domain-containing protein [Campylobacter gastrosuis]|uniref:Periplasmic protein n=1 Tax=Campylobacter gastrosuis TaxID=2974576 RepID=A0ABT7HSB9_9BACT|nr:hypothetical protein [Campylobacter gastrosuis]MDL0089627.1 hypothetical protein [Campylobacter gastrosuis]